MDTIQLNYILDKFYNKDILIELYNLYFNEWLKKGYVTSTLGTNLDMPTLRKSNKALFLNILYQFYILESVTKKIYPTLTPAVQKAFFQIAWDMEPKVSDLEKEFQIKVGIKGDRYYSQSSEFKVLEPQFYFFRYKEHDYYSYYSFNEKKNKELKGTLILPDEISRELKKTFPKPHNYMLHPIEKPQSAFTHNATEEILNNIELYQTYIAEGHLQKSPKTGAILTASLKTMHVYCQVPEFFSDNTISYDKTSLLAHVLNMYRPRAYTSSAELAKNILTDFFQNIVKFPLQKCFLPHIKGYNTFFEIDPKFNNKLQQILSALPGENQWVSVENISDYMLFHAITLQIIDQWSAERYMYITKPYEYGTIKQYIDKPHYHKYITIPLLQGIFFLLAAFGVLEIAYDNAPILTELGDKTLTPFSGLRGIKLTAFGKYILGKQAAFDISGIKTETGTVLLDEYSLTAVLQGENKILQLTLEKIGTPLGNNRYQIDFTSLFKECKSSTDIKRKIQVFSEKISVSPPQNWKKFFQQAVQQVNPLTLEKEYVVLRIQRNPALIRHIATDPSIKPFILKTEGYRIVVADYMVNHVKKRLTELGYFSESRRRSEGGEGGI